MCCHECCPDLPFINYSSELNALPLIILIPDPYLQSEMKPVSFGYVAKLLEVIAVLSLPEFETHNKTNSILKEALNSPLNSINHLKKTNWVKGFNNLIKITEGIKLRCITTHKLHEAQEEKVLLLTEVRNRANEYKAKAYKNEHEKKSEYSELSISAISLLKHLNDINTEIRKNIRRHHKKYYAKITIPLSTIKKSLKKQVHRIVLIQPNAV